MILKGLEHCKKLYFIGIGGVSMSALAKLAKMRGYDVCGSDGVRSEQTENLAFYGIRVRIGVDEDDGDLLSADAVVYTDAIPKENKELCKALQLKKRIFSRAEFLALVAKNHHTVITVAGSHGKTTCTSVCAHVLKGVNVPFTAHIGGEDKTFGNFYTCGDEYFVTEACEYKKNLLKLTSNVAILLNIDKDHMECYDGEQDLFECFRAYCQNAQTAFVCADDKKCLALGDFASFGIDNVLADYRAVKLKAVGEKYAFTVEEYGKELCRVKLNALGKSNVYNALAAFAAMRSLGFDERGIVDGLEGFCSVKRRFERIGGYRGASFICDYAHHPREIISTVKTAEGICRGSLYVVFQPHTYSRTKLLMGEFVKALREIKNLMLYKTYAAREKYDVDGSALRLAENLGGCLYAENVYTVKAWLKSSLREGDLVLFLGAGDIYYAAQYLLTELQ